MKRLILAVLATAWCFGAHAQTVQSKLTVGVSNTYQQLLPPNQGRKDCLVQYVPVAGTKGFIFFGAAAPADTTTSFQLAAGTGLSINCSSAQFAQKKGVWVTATATDIFVFIEDAGSEP